MLLGTLSATLSGNLLTGKGTIRTHEGKFKHPRIFKASSSFKNYLEIQQFYQNKP